MYIERMKNLGKCCSQNFYFRFHIQVNVSLNGLERRGKSHFSCTSIEPVHLRLHAVTPSCMVPPT